jgi:Zn-dependent peptidase ImmA (M78 family)
VELVGQFRRTGSAAPIEDADGIEALALLKKLATSYAELENLLGEHQSRQYEPERRIGRGALADQAEDLALEIRNHLGAGLMPVSDMVSLLELGLGIRVFVRALPSRIGAVYAYAPEVGACILLNLKHPRERRMWSAAHDLAHFLTARLAPDVCYIGESKAITERFADKFAAAFLMPAVTIRRRFAEYCDRDGRFSARHLVILAQELHVSAEALARRLEDLGLLPSGTYETMRERGFAQPMYLHLLGDRAPEAPHPLPPRFAVLVAEAFQRELITEGQAADMLALSRADVRGLLDDLAWE